MSSGAGMNGRPRLLDLFCCQGGAGEGYRRAGFDVTGVDIEPQPRNPHRFIQADAIEYLAEHGQEYDAIHASPPCQAFSRAQKIQGNSHPDLISPLRPRLAELGVPFLPATERESDAQVAAMRERASRPVRVEEQGEGEA